MHVGPAKTGTSAVQHVLREHDGSVVLYPNVGLWADGSHHNLVFNHFGDLRRSEVIPEDSTAMFARIGDQARATDRSVVISSEALAGSRTAKFIAALLPHLGLAGSEVEIVVVCREHYARAASLYSQRLKDATSLERREPGDYLRASAERLCYAPLLRLLRSSGYPLHIINYHPSDDFLVRFLSHLGFPADWPVVNEARNVSLSVRGIIALLAVNRVALNSGERRRLAMALRGLKDRFRSSGFIFDPRSAAAVAPIFAADRQTLLREWGVDLPVINLAQQTNKFFLNEQDIGDIGRACRDLGSEGDAIVRCAQEFVC